MSAQIRALLPVVPALPLHFFRVHCWLNYPCGAPVAAYLDYLASTVAHARQQFNRETLRFSNPSALFHHAEPLGILND